MDLRPGERIMFEGHPSTRALLSFYLIGVGGAVVIAVVLGLLAGPALAIVAGVVLAAVVIAVGLALRMSTRYLITSQRVSIRHGVFAKRVQQTRIDRIQNVNTQQSLLDRILRVGTVDFETAGTDDGELRFVGIASPDEVAAAVDLVHRQAAERRAEPRFTHDRGAA
jgi:uncharacterized membrane protein YdbT with pleckstrin-like domain